GEHDGIGRIHDRGAQQVADGVQVIGGLGHDVAGAVALVVGVGEALQVREQVISQVELDVARNTDDHPPGQKLKDTLGKCDTDDHQRIGEQFRTSHALIESVYCFANDLGEENPDAVIEQDADSPQQEAAAIALQIGDERL